jgi:DNA-binding IclR family transcriptional regulator
MDYLTYHKRLEYILELAGKGQLLSLQQLERKFDCSKSTVKRMLSTLREMDKNIEYCRSSKKFVIKS